MNINLPLLKQALVGQMQKNNVVSNNLSNINTDGFKKDRLFFEALKDEMNAPAKVRQVTDFEAGQLHDTGNPLDCAITGSGFFVVEMPEGLAYTREGHFQVDQDGFLRNGANLPVLGEGGLINVLTPQGAMPDSLTITEKGEIYADDQAVGKLLISDFENSAALQKIGNSLFRAGRGAMEIEASDAVVRQGFLEGSNVNPAEEMMALIEVQRQFESVQRTVRTMDEVLKNAVNKIGSYS